MSNRLLQRVVGSVVLLTAATLIVVLIMSGQNHNSAANQRTIALTIPQPRTAVLPSVAQNIQAETSIPMRGDPDQAQPQATPPNSALNLNHNQPKTKNKITAASRQQQTWVIQLASLSSSPSAKNLVKELQQQGYHAHIRKEISKKGSTVYRIYLGPINNKNQAQLLRDKLVKKTKMKGLIFSSYHYQSQ